MNIDDIFHATKASIPNFTPRFRAHGGTPAENLALQNIQARSRMVVAYYYGIFEIVLNLEVVADLQNSSTDTYNTTTTRRRCASRHCLGKCGRGKYIALLSL